MPADSSTHVISAGKRRHELTRAKAIKAIRELARTGGRVDFATVADRAGVSRSWLYTQPEINANIQRLRGRTARTRRTPIPAR